MLHTEQKCSWINEMKKTIKRNEKKNKISSANFPPPFVFLGSFPYSFFVSLLSTHTLSHSLMGLLYSQVSDLTIINRIHATAALFIRFVLSRFVFCSLSFIFVLTFGHFSFAFIRNIYFKNCRLSSFSSVSVWKQINILYFWLFENLLCSRFSQSQRI